MTPSLSVIIIQYNHSRLTLEAIRTFRRHCGETHQIIVVDNGSTESEAQTIVAQLPGIQFIRNDANEGFGKANNRGAREAHGDILLFLNNDTITKEDFVQPILSLFADTPTVGVAGPRLVNIDGTYQLSSGRLPSVVVEIRDKLIYRWVAGKGTLALRYAEGRAAASSEVEWVTGAALFVRHELFARIGGFDEDLFMYFEDKDLCARARMSGTRVRYVHECSLVHLGGGSLTPTTAQFLGNAYRKSQIRYYGKHRPVHEQLLLHGYLKLTGKEPHD